MLDEVGAILRSFLTENHKTWWLVTFPCLHAGVIHLVINFCSIIFIGIHWAQEFGTLKTELINVLSALYGTLEVALFVDNVPTVGFSTTLYGLHGATLFALIQNWNYTPISCNSQLWHQYYSSPLEVSFLVCCLT